MIQEADRKLIDGCIRKKQQAQADFIGQFSNLVYRSVQGTLRTKQKAFQPEDLADFHNTVFLKLFDQNCKKLRQYEGKNGCSLASWIRMISVQTVLDHLRRTRDAIAVPRRTISIDFLQHPSSEEPSVLEAIHHKEQVRRLTDAVERLKPRDQLFVKLCCLQEMPIHRVAGIMNITENNAYSIKHRIIKRLKKIMLPQVQDEAP